MSWTICVAVLLVVMTSSLHQASAQKKLVCYYSSWATYRNGNGKFGVENINPQLCTHAIYAFVGLNMDGTVKILDEWNDISLRGFARFNDLKKSNTNLKTLVAIGGWNEGSAAFSAVTASASLRASFVSNVYNFVKSHGFNGLDLDWEYPAQRGGSSADKQNFVYLLRELRAKFAPDGLLLSAAVGVGSSLTTSSYSVPDLASNLDWINLMTYDLHGSWESVTGHNAPLYAAAADVDKSINVDAAVQHWISKGAPPSKLVLGVALYGRSFTLKSAANNGVGAASTGPGAAGPYTQETGMMGYNEICELQKVQAGWTVRWDATQQVPHMFRESQWIGYDNVQSVAAKGSYIKSKGLAGGMVWALEMDDFLNFCGAGANPLINKLKTSMI